MKRLPKPYWQSSDGGAVLYCGDCLELLPLLDAGSVDAVVTDPPYGVGFDGKARHYRNEPNTKRIGTYSDYDDTPENFSLIVLPAIEKSIQVAKRGIVFMASINIQKLPPGELGGIFLPNGCGRSSWGFQCFMHAVFYGKCPYVAAGMRSRPNGKYGLYGNDSNKIDHPCAKPIAAMIWAVERTSFREETIFDPFAGSGTTGVAAIRTGRKCILIEKEEKYCAIAAKRMAEACCEGEGQLPFERPVLFGDPDAESCDLS